MSGAQNAPGGKARQRAPRWYSPRVRFAPILAALVLSVFVAGCPPVPPPVTVRKAPIPRGSVAKPAQGVARATTPLLEPIAWPGDGDLLGIAALTTSQALAVGVPGAVWIDGSRVRVAPFPDGIADAVWADGPSFAVVVGYGGISHLWNGKTWTAAPTGVDADLHAVWGRGSGKSRQIFAGGSKGTILSWVDGAWTRMKAPDSVIVSAFAGAGEKLWAVGQTSGETNSEGAILRLDGDTWVDACKDLACGGAIYAAFAPDANDLWTAGAAGELVHYANGQPELLRSGTRGAITAIWGTGRSDLFVAGDGGFCLHWNGKTWAPLPSSDEDLRAMSGLPNGEAWIAGGAGTIRHVARPAPVGSGS